MKTKLFALALATGLFLNSCSSSDNPTPTTPTPATGEISGTITANKTYAYGNYTLKGIVKINAGVTVTFDAGSTITIDKATGDNALVVLKGGKLITNGTADKPVVFTEKSKLPGSWGGIIVYGDAPVKVAGGGTSGTSEDGNKIAYGGAVANDNSGSLVYTRVEYAGSKLADGDKENNGFTFYSVGSGTVLDHLVSYKGADDGYEFFGGTVSLTNSISYGNYDDSFDWQDGWQGQTNTNWYAYQTGKGNYGMEIEASLNDNAFGPKVSNITLRRAAGNVPEVGDNQVDAFQFKREGNGEYSNIIIDGYGNFTNAAGTVYTGSAVSILDAATNDHQVKTSKIKLLNVKITNTTNVLPIGATSAIVVAFPTGTFVQSATATGASLTGGAWATVDGVDLTK
ncbi:hypothetical protein SAMN05444397_107196 [Flavobacterium aquidurense]|uniref:Lipoprotein n=1 Tax=Flavobacterium frigidimaris TaxID=262320 RepID=A0ABX4BWG9_FLAFR|nr:hypothetical protein [Flavobacterium frigidimaris]OXA82491.1 hypothetical protein B0A65_00375 [Flavobacterium frigidimaris]SDZ48035.1 hypothetical protein SAMN05444397_107196 [Flavobacterium aquidurense]